MQAAGLKYNSIDFDKEMTIRGMGGFTDPPCAVLSQSIVAGTTDALFINITVSMDNRSPVAIDDMGMLNLSMIVRAIARMRAETTCFSLL